MKLLFVVRHGGTFERKLKIEMAQYNKVFCEEIFGYLKNLP
jgi:hypothetical protein